KTVFNGVIEGFAGGTGAAFALIPAQNATGNWIKVVQRLPVRVSIDPKELVDHPLRVGLSMEATVDVKDTSGKALADAPRSAGVGTATALESNNADADAEVRKVIAANLGRSAARAAPASAKAPVAAASAVTAPRAVASSSSVGASVVAGK
ncbi:MAG: EmrA/EmrK family multidrug efflux transporter periplasmic adaptor subunit, partial [Rhizobacter sp.]